MSRIYVRKTPELEADLAVLTREGATVSDAVRTAVHVLADAHRYLAHCAERSDGRQPDALSTPTSNLRVVRTADEAVRPPSASRTHSSAKEEAQCPTTTK